MKLHKSFILFILSCALIWGAVSCVKVDYSLGYGFVPDNEKFVTSRLSVPIDSVLVGFIDSLSGYSSNRMTIGALRDEKYGLTRRGTAFPLVPLVDSLHWGTNIRFRQFRINAIKDTNNFERPDQENIIQNFRVYALDKSLDSTVRYSCEIRKEMFEGREMVSNGVVMYRGSDSLAFDLSEKFARTYWQGMEGTTEAIDTVANYTAKHPGIYICCDDPVGLGGRLNFFNVSPVLNSSSQLTSTYAELKITADYTDSNGNIRKDVDTTFYFGFGGLEASVSGSFYTFNTCEHESKEKEWGKPVQIECGEKYMKTVYLTDTEIPIEGGVGIKPLIQAKHLRRIVSEAMRDTVEKYGINLEEALRSNRIVINKATITLPFDAPDDFDLMEFYPQVLNPSLRISSRDTVTYAGLTDSSVSSENQGDVDRSNLCYRPDISYHMQNILSTTSADTLRRENIWFLILANEVITDDSSDSSSDASDYYSQMAYLNYYNSMLGGYGGYGGYSGYGYGSGYGSYYDNYYNYYMMQSMYSSMYSSSTTTTSTLLDRDRFYNAVLRGSGADKNKGDVPHLDITYSFLKP